jgi:hypothetical protein
MEALDESFVTISQTLDRHDLMPICLNGKYDARSGRLAIKQDGAGTTDALFATHVSTGQIQFMSQEIT